MDIVVSCFTLIQILAKFQNISLSCRIRIHAFDIFGTFIASLSRSKGGSRAYRFQRTSFISPASVRTPITPQGLSCVSRAGAKGVVVDGGPSADRKRRRRSRARRSYPALAYVLFRVVYPRFADVRTRGNVCARDESNYAFRRVIEVFV